MSTASNVTLLDGEFLTLPCNGVHTRKRAKKLVYYFVSAVPQGAAKEVGKRFDDFFIFGHFF